MVASAEPLSEIDILSQVVMPEEPSLPVELAQWVLKMRFSDEAQDHVRDLLDKNNRGTLSESDRGVLDKYLRVGRFIDLLQAKARLTLRQASES
jgi:hypothetical protein